MKTGFKIIFLLLVILVLGQGARAQTFSSNGNPADTPTGTGVTAEAADETISYKDNNTPRTQMPTVEVTGDVTHTTTSEYGFSMAGISGLTVTPGDTVTNEYAVTNEGNVVDDYTFSHYYAHGGGASNWTVEVWVAGAFDVTLEAGVVTSEARTVNDDGHKLFYYKVMVASGSGDAPNGSYITILTTLETSSGPAVGQYTGGNALTYGGTSEATDTVTDEVAAPVLVLTRTSTIDAPIAFTGGGNDAVPGAVITFTMTISNDGTASAESVVLVDQIPNFTDGYTTLAHVNASGECTNVTIEAAQGTFNGWTVFYTTEAEPEKTYEASGWTLIGTTESGAAGEFPGDGITYLEGSAEASARWIKWEKLYVHPSDDNKTLTWGVTIR